MYLQFSLFIFDFAQSHAEAKAQRGSVLESLCGAAHVSAQEAERRERALALSHRLEEDEQRGEDDEHEQRELKYLRLA